MKEKEEERNPLLDHVPVPWGATNLLLLVVGTFLTVSLFTWGEWKLALLTAATVPLFLWVTAFITKGAIRLAEGKNPIWEAVDRFFQMLNGVFLKNIVGRALIREPGEIEPRVVSRVYLWFGGCVAGTIVLPLSGLGPRAIRMYVWGSKESLPGLGSELVSQDREPLIVIYSPGEEKERTFSDPAEAVSFASAKFKE